jgi:hypothetical protein
MKSIFELSLPLSFKHVYTNRLTRKHFQGLLMMDLGGRCPYLSLRLLFVWQVLQDFVTDRMVIHHILEVSVTRVLQVMM